MKEKCGCGAGIEDVLPTETMSALDIVREWRAEHRHEAPPLRASGPGGTAATERAWSPTGFAVPDQTEAM